MYQTPRQPCVVTTDFCYQMKNNVFWGLFSIHVIVVEYETWIAANWIVCCEGQLWSKDLENVIASLIIYTLAII